MEHNDLRQMAELMKDMELTLLEITEGDSVVRMERAASRQPIAAAPVLYTENQPNQLKHVETHVPQKDAGKDVYTVSSPMIGVFYASPAPDQKPYVKVGDTVHPGDVLCIIEAMKMMNEITADVSGVVMEICVGSKQIVDYGHPLFRIRLAEPDSSTEK